MQTKEHAGKPREVVRPACPPCPCHLCPSASVSRLHRGPGGGQHRGHRTHIRSCCFRLLTGSAPSQMCYDGSGDALEPVFSQRDEVRAPAHPQGTAQGPSPACHGPLCATHHASAVAGTAGPAGLPLGEKVRPLCPGRGGPACSGPSCPARRGQTPEGALGCGSPRGLGYSVGVQVPARSSVCSHARRPGHWPGDQSHGFASAASAGSGGKLACADASTDGPGT